MRIFGEVLEGIYYKDRKGAYGIAINEMNQVASKKFEGQG